MKRSDFLKDALVQEFIDWMAPRLDQDNSLIHRYTSHKPKAERYFDSLYSAFEKYDWNQKDFVKNHEELTFLSEGLKKAIKNNDNDAARYFCFSILSWGNVLPKNNKTIDKYGDNLVDYLIDASQILHPEYADTSINFDKIKMNSGFTKIYSLIIDDFIIYDSRVGAAIGILVYKFCRDTDQKKVPELLKFAYGNEKTGKNVDPDRRNPSTSHYIFTHLTGAPKTKNKLHIIHNIRANWLLKEILVHSKSKFRTLRELEAALFMLGYDIQYLKQP